MTFHSQCTGALTFENFRIKLKFWDQAADHCGQIEPGDLLTHVDSLDIARGVASQFLADLIAGPQGSVVNLTFEKADGSRVSINLLRGNADYIAQVLRERARARERERARARERERERERARVALVHYYYTASKPTTIPPETGKHCIL